MHIAQAHIRSRTLTGMKTIQNKTKRNAKGKQKTMLQSNAFPLPADEFIDLFNYIDIFNR